MNSGIVLNIKKNGLFATAKKIKRKLDEENAYKIWQEKNRLDDNLLELQRRYLFKEDYKKALSFCGSHSGRDCDKAKETGLTPVFVSENGVEVTAFAEADMVLVCQKAYVQEMKPECFVDTENDEKWYSDKDYHYQYIGEIVKAFVKE